MNNYCDLLKDPRWLKKRRKILKRDGFKCTVCDSKSKLNIHHTYYTGQNTPPWAYPNNSLLTICNSCHEKYHREHELTIQKHHNPSGKRKNSKKIKPQKVLSLKELYKIWEPRITKKSMRLKKYTDFNK